MFPEIIEVRPVVIEDPIGMMGVRSKATNDLIAKCRSSHKVVRM